MTDRKYEPMRYGRVIIVIEDSYASPRSYILRCKSLSKNGTNDFIFDDQIGDLIRALKLIRRSLFWRRLWFRIFLFRP